MPIRKGDGTTLAPKGYQEIRLGDGTVLYSDGGGLVNRWQFSEGSGSAVADSEGSDDGTITDATWTSGTWIGDNALDFNGSSAKVDTPATTPSRDLALYATVSFDTSKSDSEHINTFGNPSGDSDTYRSLEFDGSGNVRMGIRNDATNFDTVSTSITTGTHRIVGYVDTVNEELGIAVDGTLQNTTATRSSVSASNVGEHGIGYRRNDNFGYFNGIIDEPMVQNAVPTSQELTDDFDRQPWS